MFCNLEKDVLVNLLKQSHDTLLSSERLKFKKCKQWRLNFIPSVPGVYAFFDANGAILYIGETGNLRERMNEVNRTVNHSFRRQLGCTKYSGIKSKKKFSLDIEVLLDAFFDEHLYVSFIEVNFGRLEIETYLITRYQQSILNSKKKRKQDVLTE